MKLLAVVVVSAFIASSAIAQTSGNDGAVVIVQMSYYAQPGKEDEVLRLRLMAADVLVKRGLNRGKVWQSIESPRATRDPVGATVIWQGEFSNDRTLKQYEDVADRDQEFLAIRRQMGTVTLRTERRYYREAR